MFEKIVSCAERRSFVHSAVCLAFLTLAAVGLTDGQQAQETKPRVSDKPLTAEQIAVYKVVLHGWMDKELSTVNLSIQTVSFPTSGAFDASGCGKDLDLESVEPEVVHRFRAADMAQLSSGKVSLVDPDRQRKEVADNDPEKTIRKGKSIEEAVRNGFAHGLVTLSEIRFDKEHKHAIVSYSFFCGSLCGNGGAVILEKIDGAWQRKSQCGAWIS
jgi:hypothetical protein